MMKPVDFEKQDIAMAIEGLMRARILVVEWMAGIFVLLLVRAFFHEKDRV